MRHTIALFGEAEKGDFSTLLFFSAVSQLSDGLGNPPAESRGIPLAIQALLYDRNLIFIRVKEEGFSTRDYLKGLKQLEDKTRVKSLSGICLPGVGDSSIIDSATHVCEKHKSILLTAEQDLYDYLTSIQLPPQIT